MSNEDPNQESLTSAGEEAIRVSEPRLKGTSSSLVSLSGRQGNRRLGRWSRTPTSGYQGGIDLVRLFS